MEIDGLHEIIFTALVVANKICNSEVFVFPTEKGRMVGFVEMECEIR
jgi:hypothetical protein